MTSLLALSLATSFHIQGNHIEIRDAHITSYGRGLAVKDDSHERVIGNHCTMVYHGRQCFDDLGGAVFYHLVSKNPVISQQIKTARWTRAYELSGTFKEIHMGDENNSYFEVEVDQFQ